MSVAKEKALDRIILYAAVFLVGVFALFLLIKIGVLNLNPLNVGVAS